MKNATALAKVGWLLALLPLYGPVILVCLLVIAACIATMPMLAVVPGAIAIAVIRDKIEKRRNER